MSSWLTKQWRSIRAKQKINKLTRKIFYKLYNVSTDPLEFGNIRRSADWGEDHDGQVRWVVLVDMIIGRPIQYIITHSPDDDSFSCYSATAKTNFTNVFQFSTTDLEELEFRLTELGNHIPSLRERMLREYVFGESKNAPGRKWFLFFLPKNKKREEYLNAKIDALYNQKKITKSELARAQIYIANLI